MFQIPLGVVLFLLASGFFAWLHLAFAVSARYALRGNREALAEIFVPPDIPKMTRADLRQLRLRAKFLWPGSAIISLAHEPLSVRATVWGARLSGTALVLCVLGSAISLGRLAL